MNRLRRLENEIKGWLPAESATVGPDGLQSRWRRLASHPFSTEYHLKCPKCGHEFDFDYSQWNSSSDPDVPGISYRYGPHRFSINCPSCHKRSRYHVSEKEGVNPTKQR
jgi:endogenous inhibitor of DNA gyrase (YacG/DUF329 family)